MSRGALERMHARARDVRTRAAVRGWNYRQRNLAGGVWFRLRRVLAEAQAAFEIDDQDVCVLLAEGYREEPSGHQIAPEKAIIFVDAQRLRSLPSGRAIPVSLGPTFLAARGVALVRFEHPESPAGRPG